MDKAEEGVILWAKQIPRNSVLFKCLVLGSAHTIYTIKNDRKTRRFYYQVRKSERAACV